MTNDLGSSDLEMWNEVYQPVFKNFDKITQGSLKDFKVLTVEEEDELFRLVSKIQRVNREPVIFMISLLVVLTKTGKGIQSIKVVYNR